MRVIRKFVVLAFAGLGIYKAWELASAQFAVVRQRAADAKARIEPALHETEDTVHAASGEVSASIQNLSHTVADAVTTSAMSPSSASAPLDAPTPLNSSR